MGNIGSSNNSTSRRRHTRRETTQNHPPPPPPPPPQPLPELNANRYIFAAATPYPNPNPNTPPPYPSYYQYPTGAYYPPPPPLQQPYDHRVPVAGRYPVNVPAPAPYVDHQKAVTIKNDVNIKKQTLNIVPDDDDHNIGKFLVEFTFDATVSGSITLYFFAKEGEGSNMTTTKDDKMLPPITFSFKQGLGQRFKQESGTGIDLSAFEESEISKVGESRVYPLVIKAEAAVCVLKDGTTNHKSMNVQITQAVFEKDKGEYRVRVVKQILWVNGMRYELQEIYGIGNTVDGSADLEENDPGKECVICLSEPRDTTVLPCRHMCMCSGCAKLLRFQTNRCPICRQPVERLLEIKVSSDAED